MKRSYGWVILIALLCFGCAGGGELAGDDDDSSPSPETTPDDDDDNDDDDDGDSLGFDSAPPRNSRSYCRFDQATNHYDFGNDQVAITFGRPTGRILQLTDRRRGLKMIGNAAATWVPPFDLFSIEPGFFGTYKLVDMNLFAMPPRFVCRDNRLTITWEHFTSPISFEAVWEVARDKPELRATARVTGAGEFLIHRFRYPVLAPLAPLAGHGADDRYLMSLEGGAMLQDPLARLAEEVEDNADILCHHRYPMGHGAMAQLVAYLNDTVGGLLIYTADPEFNAKTFSLCDHHDLDDNPEKPDLPALPQFHIAHLNPRIGAADFALDYPVILRFLDSGDWQEAATIYREWSDKQIWAGRPLAEREPEERAFFETLGASVFGLTSRYDQTAWINAFHDELVADNGAARLLFVQGWDFHPMGDPDPEAYFAIAQAGWDERFWRPFYPSTQTNLGAIATQGDMTSLFYYDLLVGTRVPGWDGFYPESPGTSSYFDYLLVNPRGSFGGFSMFDVINFGMIYAMNPADPYVADFWLWRDRLVVDEAAVPLDALYFDLGFPLIERGNYDILAGHDEGQPSGSGGWFVQAVRDTLDQSRGQPTPRGFRYGAENTTEPYFDLVDFYHLGGMGVGPLRNRAGNSDPPSFRVPQRWFVEGTAREVPLLAYLHHHNGGTRTGGKMTASYELGNVFYWVALAEYLSGGVVELIYFNTPVDWLPDLDPSVVCRGSNDLCGFQTGWIYQPDNPESTRGWYYDDEVRQADPEKLAFLRRMIDLRINSPAAPYLTLGRMETAPRVPNPLPLVAFDYDFYFSISGPPYCHSGQWSAKPLHITAWRHPYDDRVAILVGNATDAPLSVGVEIDPAVYGYAAAELWSVTWEGTVGERESLGCLTAPRMMDLTVPGQDVLLFELVP
ncbi:MAG: hypothetical protein P9L99_06375 [Candidatus Lernaella stagnicola]|nr:hypothetical protein [Candidatus Lernaella stagnicola]